MGEEKGLAGLEMIVMKQEERYKEAESNEKGPKEE